MQWKTIPGFSRFEISDCGDLRCVVPGFNSPIGMRKADFDRGYRSVRIRDDSGCKRKLYIHRAVALAFIGPSPSPNHEVAHGDGDRSNNRLDNLRWATGKENAVDCDLHGTRVCGSKTWNAALTEEQAAEIIGSNRPGAELAAAFGVSQATISMLRNGHTWRHLDRPKRAA